MKIKLDAATCAAALCPPGKRKETLWDTVTQGFAIEIRANGGKTYYLRYFDTHGRQRQHRIAGFMDLSFDMARREAKRLRSIVVLGGDPATAKDVKKATISYADLARQHLEYAKTFQKRPENTEAILRVHILPRWDKLRLDEIRTQDIARWFGDKYEGLAPATVEKIRVVFSRSFELGRQWEITGAETNPVRNVPRRRFSNARQRYLTAVEAERLFRALDRSDNPQLKSIVGLLLYTGARKSELLNAEWSDVDLERRAWYIPTTKTGKPRHVPLSQAAMAIIEALPRFKDCPYLVPNPATRKPYVTLKRAWEAARREACLGDLRLHDIRHAAASAMVGAGIDLYAVGRILGHVDHQSTQRYAHLANDTLMAAVEAGAKKMNWSKSV